MRCLENNSEYHCEGVKRPWQSQSANTVYNKESRTPLTAVGTLTSLLRNSTKVLENLSQMLFNFRFVQMFSAVFILSVCAIGNTWAANPSGTCGTNCNWTIENGTLKITGGSNGEIGTMDDYNVADDDSYGNTPWRMYNNLIKSADISGIKNVGVGALKNVPIQTLNLGNTITKVGSAAFYGNQLSSLNIPDSVQTLEWASFLSGWLQNVVLPDTVQGLSERVFGDWLSNMQILCRGTDESCKNIALQLENYRQYNHDNLTWEDQSWSNLVVPATGELCNSEKYYWNGEQCLREENSENRTCVEGWYKQENYCAMYLCEYYNKLSSCNESIVGCAKTVCEEDGSLADGTPCYKEVEQSIAPSCGENAHLVDNESTCKCVCNNGYTGDGATCVAINCAAGEFWNGEQCTACSDETYSAGGFVTECSANTAEHCASKSTTANVCSSCAANYFMDGTTCTAINCSAGEFFDMSAKVCKPCVEGEWNDVAAATSCMPNTAANCATYSKTTNVCSSCAAKFKFTDNECVMMTCAEVYPDSSETQCETTTSGCSVTTCSEVGSLADGTKCYKASTVDYTPNCDSNATLTGEGASCACVCNTGFEGSGTSCTAISCPAGKYLDGSECKTCAAGSYAGAGDNVCSSCGAHEYSAAGASSCSPRNNMSNCNSFATDSDECTSCKTGYKAENGGCVSLCSGGKVYWDGECYDEYPFAKKRYTPAEADKWLKDDGNVVTLIFKK